MKTLSAQEKCQILLEIGQLEEHFSKIPLRNVDWRDVDPTTIDVVAVGCLVYLRDRYTLLVRTTQEPNEWVIPGGVVDPGESLLHAAVREVKKETGLDRGI